ncbi:MAG: hypothetical protein DSY80_08375, partial [Desulfocapsa sp.]
MLQSLRAKLRLMLFLLALLIPLMLLNYSMNRATSTLDQTYGTLAKVNERLTDNIAGELFAIGNPEKFSTLQESYHTLYASCKQCHTVNSGAIIRKRSELLQKLHHNQMIGVSLRKTLNENLNQ